MGDFSALSVGLIKLGLGFGVGVEKSGAKGSSRGSNLGTFMGSEAADGDVAVAVAVAK